MKAVIFNADDFGLNATTNKAILLAHTEGVLTSASLMVTGDAAVEAAQIARDIASLAVGLHLVLVDGKASLPYTMVPRLANEFGMFESDDFKVGLRYFFSNRARWEVQQEVEAQFRQFASLGLNWSHVDGHHHFHMHPVVWDAMITNCEEYDIKRLRIPHEERLPTMKPQYKTQKMERRIFELLRKRRLRSLANKGFIVPERVYGHLQSGNMNEEYLLSLLERISGQTNEIYLHPGTPHAQKMPGRKGLDVELHALLSDNVKEKIEDLSINACTYLDLE